MNFIKTIFSHSLQRLIPKVGLGFICFILTVSLSAQKDENFTIKATVLEQLEGSIRGLAHTVLEIKGIGEYQTDNYGQLMLSASFSDLLSKTTDFILEIGIPEYQVIKPYDGRIELDSASSEITLEIIVVGRDVEEEYQEQLKSLTTKLNRTKRRANLSVKRMNALNDSLLVSMQRSDNEKSELRSSITALEKRTKETSTQNETLKNELEYSLEQMEKLENRLRAKENELYEALEEKYLRQQEAELAITTDLRAYLISLRDVNDLMKNVDQYFKPGKHPNYVTTYNGTLKQYNEVFHRINEHYADHVAALKRYWNTPELVEEAQQTFEILFDQIHHPKLKPSIAQINGYIRSGKKGKAAKFGQTFSQEMNPLIINFEKAVNRVLDKL